MTVTKKQLVAQLKETAKLLEVLNEDPFRARAFAQAARQIDAYEGDVGRLLAEDHLTEIRGVGKGLAAELAALKEQETLPLLDELHARVPAGVRSLFAVSGIGAKKIALLWQEGITDLSELVAAAQDGRIAAMKGFGKKSAENIAAAAQFALLARRRYRLDVAEAYLLLLRETLQAALLGVVLTPVGELRRGCETVGELELLISDASLKDIKAALAPLAITSIEEAENWLAFELDGRSCRLFVTEADSFGATLAFHTGNEAYRQTLLEAAGAQGFELTERGLFAGQEPLVMPTEEEFFEKLELPFISPERRETGSPIPIEGLLTLSEIRGAVHNHSTYSDGANSLREMVAASRTRGFAYLAMADHSRSSQVANGLSIERVLEQAEEIASIREELLAEGSDFELLHGLEVDIMTDGSLDYPDEVLAQLDYLVVSVHQNFGLSEAAQTERIVRAVQHPYVSILAHPTGRLLLRRPEYAVDVPAVIEACAASGTIIEINANPRRLDLDWRWVIPAEAEGCKFSINPDAHHIDGLDLIRYGVTMARKAGLTAKDVVNTAPTAAEFLAQLKRPEK